MGNVTDSAISGRRPRVGAIIVNYNAGSYLADCVARIVPHVSAVAVVDNASQDDSLAVLEGSMPPEANIKIFRQDSNLGFASACNIGIDQLLYDYLLFLNPDCLLDPDAIASMMDSFEIDPRVGMVGGLLLNSDGSEQAGARRAVPTPWRSFVRAFGLARLSKRWPRLFFDFHLHRQPLPKKPIEVEAISGACMLVRRDAMDDVGRWDEGYFLHCEDLDLCMRFRQKGWKVVFVPSARMLHVRGASSKGRKIFVEWHKHKGMQRFYRKFFRRQYPGALMWLVTLGVWIRFGLIVAANVGHRVLRGMGLPRD
jgi:GT2 family glycosyltransferase